MTVKGVAVKLIILTLSCCTFAYLVPACSTGGQFTASSNILGAGEAKSGMTDENLSKVMSRLRPHPGNAEGHYQLGCWYYERSRHQEAIKEFQKAIYIKPDYTEAYNGLGVCYDWQGDYAAASDAYRMALKLNPNSAYVYNNLGHSCILQGKNGEAVDVLRQALALGSNSNQTHNNLGLAYALSGQFDLAMKEFEYAGNKALAHTLLAKIYYQKGQFDKAKEHYGEALVLDPDSASSQKGFETSTLVAKFDAVLAQVKQAIELVMPSERGQMAASGDAGDSLNSVGMELSNGNGVNNMAKSMAQYLRVKGFHIVRLTNADKFTYQKTTLMYKPEFSDATRQVAEQLPEMPSLKEVKRLDRPNVGMKIVLGRDLMPHKNVLTEEKK
ncbi:MAG TPA: tetratricopeptide repeat protein [Syntrophorhabdales bacterium]|nr:tetratricopeptide repeat protein [Syntrophorhabdales bacterium]